MLLKRGIAATIEELLLSAEYILSGGNYDVILCERGIRTFETFLISDENPGYPSTCQSERFEYFQPLEQYSETPLISNRPLRILKI